MTRCTSWMKILPCFQGRTLQGVRSGWIFTHTSGGWTWELTCWDALRRWQPGCKQWRETGPATTAELCPEPRAASDSSWQLRKGGEGSLLARDTYGVWCDWAFFFVCFLFACWSTPKAILFIRSFHLLLGPGYRVSPASYTKRCFSRYLVLYFLHVLGKRLPVKTVSRLILSYATLWLGHHRNTDAHREGEHDCGLIYRTVNQLRERFNPTNALSEVLQQLCNTLDERGNPYHGWIFTHDVRRSSLLCETHGWIFTHNVRRESLTMIKSYVNFHPQSSPCNCYYVKVMGEFLFTAYLV